jgi:hypothetical protein
MRIDYGFLFQEGDLFRRKTDSIDYGYYEEHPEEKGEPGSRVGCAPRTFHDVHNGTGLDSTLFFAHGGLGAIPGAMRVFGR